MSTQETPADFTTPTGRTAKVHHGDYSAYVNYGCRCDSCRTAGTETARSYRKRRKFNTELAARP